MQVKFGVGANGGWKGRDVVWDTTQTINPHCLVLGETGAGKTHQLRNMVRQMVATGGNEVRIHVFDSHGDVFEPGWSSVLFSESTDFGFNPLELSADPHFGGVRKRVQSFIAGLSQTSHKLGHRQEGVLRKLLVDLYSLGGFSQDDPSTWYVDPSANGAIQGGRMYLEVPYEEKDRAQAAGARFDREASAWWIPKEQYQGDLLRWGAKQFGKRYPTLLDAVRFARSRHRAMFTGSNNSTMRQLAEVNKLAKQMRAKEQRALKLGDDSASNEQAQRDLEAAKRKTVEAFTHAVHAVKSGRELDDLLKYDSAEVLESVLDSLENLLATGIFRSTPPPFHPRAAVWRYEYPSLREDEKRLFLTYRLEAKFEEAMQRGPTDRVREVFVIDEADIYTSNNPDHILNRLIKQARKFGIALVLASQSPDHFSDEMLSGVAVRVFIGMDKMHSSMAERKLGVDQASLGYIVPQMRAVVQMKMKRVAGAQAIWVDFSSNVRSRSEAVA